MADTKDKAKEANCRPGAATAPNAALALDRRAQPNLPALFNLPTTLSDWLLAPGVNYVGYLTAHLGVGEAARNMAAALADAGTPVAALDISNLSSSPRGQYDILGRLNAGGAEIYPTTILHVNADELPFVLSKLPREYDDTIKIGVWAWESSEFPDAWCDRFDLLDEIWVCSSFVAAAVAKKATIPVFAVPYVFSPPHALPDRAWLRRKAPDIQQDEFVFLFQFDTLSIPHRKNPEGAIRAFIQAFTPDQPVRLLVKTINAAKCAGLVETLRGLAAGGRVTIWDEALSNEARFKLLASVDAFVSLHRAEGFGMSIAEAMLLKKPVIVTGWSGNADFVTPTTASLVSYTLEKLPHAFGPYQAGTIWAEPSVDDAAARMRRIYEDAGYRTELGENAARLIRDRLNPETIGRLARERLQLVTPSNHRQAAPPPPAAGRLRMILRLSRDALRRPGHYARRIPTALRVLRAQGLRSMLRLSMAAAAQSK